MNCCKVEEGPKTCRRRRILLLVTESHASDFHQAGLPKWPLGKTLGLALDFLSGVPMKLEKPCYLPENSIES